MMIEGSPKHYWIWGRASQNDRQAAVCSKCHMAITPYGDYMTTHERECWRSDSQAQPAKLEGE